MRKTVDKVLFCLENNIGGFVSGTYIANNIGVSRNAIWNGYDEKFTHHMSQLIGNMSADTECAISEGCDEICQKCPNRNKEICRENDKVYKMDAKVISVCGIDYGF